MLLYNGRYTAPYSLYQHAQQLLPSSPVHTFQFPKDNSNKCRLVSKLHQKNAKALHNYKASGTASTSKSSISSSAFQSGQIRGKDKLSCRKIKLINKTRTIIYTCFNARRASKRNKSPGPNKLKHFFIVRNNRAYSVYYLQNMKLNSYNKIWANI